MGRTDPKRIKSARIHLRDCSSRETTGTRIAEVVEPCSECEAARELLSQEQPLTRAGDGARRVEPTQA